METSVLNRDTVDSIKSIPDFSLENPTFSPDSTISLDFIDTTLIQLRKRQDEVLDNIKSYLSNHRSTFQLQAQSSKELASTVNHIKQKIHSIREDILDPETGLRKKCLSSLEQYNRSLEKQKTLLQIQKYLKKAEKIEKLMTNVVHLETNKDYKAAAECLHYSLQTAQKGAEKYPFILIYRHVTKSLEDKLQQFSQMCLDLLRSSLRLDEKGIMSCISSIEHCQALLEASWIAQGNLLSLVEALTPNLFQCTLKFQENQLTMVASNLPEPIENNALEFYNFLTMLLPPTVRKPLGALFHKHVRNNYLKDWYLPLLPTDDLTPFLDRVRQFDIVDKTALTLDLLNDSMPSLSMSMDFKAFMQQKRRNQALNITRQLWFSSNLKEVIYSPPAWSTSNAAPSSVSSMELPSPFTLLDPKLVLEHPFPMHLQTISATMAEFLNVLQQYKDDPVPLLQSYLMYLNLFPTMVPRSSMLHFVDTMVLIDACKHWFMLQPNPSVAILIPLLMETVKKIYQQQLTHQKGLFFECFQPALTELTYLEKNGIEKVQLYLQRIQHLIKQLKSAIEDILPPPFFHHFLGTLMDAMLTSLLTELLSWEDITVTESELLYQCWKPFLNTISLPLRDFIPSFHTVHSLIDVLSSSLKEIQSRLQNHHYIHCSARHLQHFIHALFQESDARKSLLKEIKEGVQGGLIQI